MATELGTEAGASADPVGVANALVAKLGEIESALVPLIGVRGVAALYKRSLFLCLPAHPWLAAPYEDVRHQMTPDTLRTALLEQVHDVAMAGSQALLDTLEHLLVSLVGPSLTERLLYSAAAPAPSTPPPQDSP